MSGMPSRRTILSLITVSGIGGIAGCSDVINSEKPAHTVSVYLHNRNAVRDVTVTVKEDMERLCSNGITPFPTTMKHMRTQRSPSQPIHIPSS